MNVPTPHRHSTRLAEYDYSQNGAYFVTLCTWRQIEIFGEINRGEMQLNNWGKIVEQEWQRTNLGFPNTSMDVFVVMPNHFHGIIVIDHPGTSRAKSAGATRASPGIGSPVTGYVTPRLAGPPKGSLGVILAQFKSRVSKHIMAEAGRISASPGQIWQRNYYEHIIRNAAEWDRICKYIETNPLNWHLDEENPNRGQ
jgi:putative transposase